MNAPKVQESDYIQFLIVAQKVYSCVEAERVSPEVTAHDAYTRLLSRLPPDTQALWEEAKGLVKLKGSVVILDDSTLDKPYAKHIELVTRHWSDKHHEVVRGNSNSRASGTSQRVWLYQSVSDGHPTR
jgi:putative transposase